MGRGGQRCRLEKRRKRLWLTLAAGTAVLAVASTQQRGAIRAAPIAAVPRRVADQYTPEASRRVEPLRSPLAAPMWPAAPGPAGDYVVAGQPMRSAPLPAPGRGTQPLPPPPVPQPRSPMSSNTAPWVPSTVAPGPYLPPCSSPSQVFHPPADEAIPLRLRYKYNFGGGYTSLASPRETVVLNLQNQVTLDGTFFDRSGMPTAEQGFNIPFLRTYLYGNVTESWQYQIATQLFLGQFNILDAFVNWRYDDRLNIRAGRGLSPFLYEYYAFSPAWEPVITNSMLFQLAGKRQEGVMFWGNVAANTIQYQVGIFNGISGAFYDLDRNVDLIGSWTWTPLAGTQSIFDCFGVGAGVQTGQHNYPLNQTSSAFTNGAGEPTTNINYITSSGVPWFVYDINTAADGNQTKAAPQLFWFNRLSFLAEYLFCTRELALGGARGTTIQRGWYANTSYFLTGERYTGNGLLGYTTIEPLRPFRPSRGQYGPGAWELATQFSQISLNQNNFAFVATPNVYASRCDQLMVGVNWWPNRYTRLSLDNVWTWFNQPVLLGNSGFATQFNTVWMRCALFF